jgi:2-oxoglutarate ferredoxin oxidoreductase subunit alpha
VDELCGRVQAFLVVEMNSGQMVEDVRLSVKGRLPVEFYGRMGGVVPFPDEILGEIQRLTKGNLNADLNPREVWFERMQAVK